MGKDALLEREPGVDTGAALLAEVDFKWLMAGQGHDVDAARLHDDPAYATTCRAWARALPDRELRACTERLLGILAPLRPDEAPLASMDQPVAPAVR